MPKSPLPFAAIGLLVASLLTQASISFAAPLAGWTAELSNDFHDVGGTVTVVDENTLQFDDFTYDGDGIVVFFYLGSSDTQLAFINGLSIGDDLFGTAYDGTQPAFTVDLPPEQTIDEWNAISVWCVAADASFGSGTFTAPPLPGDYNADGIVNLADYTVWRDHLGESSEASLNGNGNNNGTVDAGDYTRWKQNFGNDASGIAAPAASMAVAVPEPSAAVLAYLACIGGLAVARRFPR